MKNTVRIALSALLVLTLAFALASCDMLPPELQDTINGLIGGKEPECQHTETKLVAMKNREPTCKATGLGDEVCVECSAVITSGVIIPKSEEHTPGDWIVIKDADCVDAGERCKRCTVCKKQVEVEVIPVNDNHAYNWGGCPKCKGVQPESTGLKFESGGNKTAVLVGIGECKDTSLVIPSVTPDGDTVVGIAAEAFKGKATITSVIVPDTVTSIGTDAFKDTGITQATAPAAVLGGVKLATLKHVKVTGSGKIPSTCMQGASKLVSITIGEGITEIGDNAFSSCPLLNSISMPASLTKIGASAFASCTGLNTLNIGVGVVTIGERAFHNCDYLYTVTVPASVKTIGSKAFYQSPRIRTVYFENPNGWTLNGTPQDPAVLADSEQAYRILLSTEAGALVRN